METINDRMEMLVNERFDGNKAAFEKAIGLPKNGIGSYLGKQRRSKPNIDMVTKIITTLNVDPLWLLTGETSAAKHIHTEGDMSPVSESGKIEINGCDAVMAERVRALEKQNELLAASLRDKEQIISLLKSQQS